MSFELTEVSPSTTVINWKYEGKTNSAATMTTKCKGKKLHIEMISTEERFRGLGLAKALIAYAVSRGYCRTTSDVCDAGIAVACHGMGFETVNDSGDFSGDADELPQRLAHENLESGNPSYEYLRNTCEMKGVGDGHDSPVVEMTRQAGDVNPDFESILKNATEIYINARGGGGTRAAAA